MRPGVFFDSETFGADRLLPVPPRDTDGEGDDGRPPAEAVAARSWRQAPLSADGPARPAASVSRQADYMPGLSAGGEEGAPGADELRGLPHRTIAALHRDVLPFLQARPHSLYGVGIDAVPAQDAWGLGLPGSRAWASIPRPGPA